MAAAKDAFLDRLEPVLPAPHRLVGRQSVLDEVKGPAGLEHATQLEQCGLDVGDRAQRPGRQRGVATVVGQWEGLTIESGTLHRDVRGREALRGELQPTSAGSIATTPLTASG
jgi:hypothetical protein